MDCHNILKYLPCIHSTDLAHFNTLAKPPVVEPKDIEHAVKVARVTGTHGIRNAALLYVLFGTGLTAGEIGRLTTHDYCDSKGSTRRKCIVRAEISYNGYERALFWSNKKIVDAIDAYLAWRVDNSVGLGTPGRYRDLDPHSALFHNGRSGGGFTATKYIKGGVERESAMVLTALFKNLLKQAGVEGSALSGRRTLAVLLARQGKDPALVREMLGLRNISQAREMMRTDPVRMADIVAKAF